MQAVCVQQSAIQRDHSRWRRGKKSAVLEWPTPFTRKRGNVAFWAHHRACTGVGGFLGHCLNIPCRLKFGRSPLPCTISLEVDQSIHIE